MLMISARATEGSSALTALSERALRNYLSLTSMLVPHLTSTRSALAKECATAKLESAIATKDSVELDANAWIARTIAAEKGIA